MTAFIIKSGVCMVLLFGLYWIFLRKEKLFIFNRYYLIFSVLFSLTVPFISFPANLGDSKTTTDILTILNNSPKIIPADNAIAIASSETVLSGISQSGLPLQPVTVKSQKTDVKKIVLFIYLIGFALMLARFCRNILLINLMVRKSERIYHEWYSIALLDNPINPFSFIHTVFINKQDYLENRIAENVIRHELEHVKQSHSFDIIFFEIIHIVFWFNPVLFLYKWSARINHEYLADEAVIVSISDMRTYAGELINFISRRVSMPFTSGFSPSMIRLRLLMLNSNTTRWSKNLRMMITLCISVLLMGIMGIRPAYPESQDGKNKQESSVSNEDIVIEEVHFRDADFNPMRALVIMNGKKLGDDEIITVDFQQIKTIDILTDRKAIHKYGKSATDGAVEISTYGTDKKSLPDSVFFKPTYTFNDKVPEGAITIPVSNLYSFSIWTYPIFPNQDLRKRWRTIEVKTRDFYSIRGRVIRQNGDPLPGVLVSAGNASGGITDKEGRFLINDIKSDVMAEFSAEGYEPVNFKVTDKVFKHDLTITLDEKNYLDKNKTPEKYKINDFSGTWKINPGRCIPPGPVKADEFTYTIHQYDSDSILMNLSMTTYDKKEFKNSNRYVFNSVKSEVDETSALKSLLSCSIDPGGHSFSVTTQIRSIIGLFGDYKRIEIYSLNPDGDQLFIRTIDFPQPSTVTGNEVQSLVFDKAIN
jgi:beta-lactamase regulating signal transducer with metallopeptidase domain